MIDTDSQGNLSTQFMNSDDTIHELADYLSDPIRGLDFCIYPTRYDNLFIIPSRKISEKGKDVSEMTRTLKSMPEVRADKIADLKERIANGTYNVSARDVAAKIVNTALEDTF